MTRVLSVSAFIGLALVAACGRPDTQALQKLGCEHVASTIDLHSVGQLDTLRKALGLAPGVDPIGICRSLGVTMEPRPQTQTAGESGSSGTNESPKPESPKPESSGGEN